jgi:hypothetical protein
VEEEEEEMVEEPIIEKPKSINAKIKDLFYDPRIGLLSLDKFYKKVQKIIPEATFKDVQ